MKLAVPTLATLRSMRLGDSCIIITAGGVPARDYPPANIASWIKQCKAVGRDDLGQKIMDGWNHCIEKHGAQILRNDSWACATVLGANSVKKNVFGHKDFVVWFQESQATAVTPLDKNQIQQAKEASKPAVVQSTGPGVPKKDETMEDWAKAAMETKRTLDEASAGMADVESFMKNVLVPQIADLERKIADYGPGGSKSQTKTGGPSKLAERIPKWQAELKVYKDKLDELTKSVTDVKSKFEAAKSQYKEDAPMAVGMEQAMQNSIEKMMEVILNMKDLEKQRDMLMKFSNMIDKQKVAASVEVNAGIIDAIMGFLKKVSDGVKIVARWAANLVKAVDNFEYTATKLGRG
jgi:predicted  nucleic acid-binding Zn-ribbon protein